MNEPSPSIGDTLLRIVLTACYRLLQLKWLVRRPHTFGAHAFAITPQRKLILVKLRYSAGWRLPGGGRRAGEKPEEAVLRELREEIGLTAFGTVRAVAELEQRPDYRRDLVSLLIVDEAIYRPRWSLEIERVMEVPLDALPSDIAPVAQAWIDAVIDKL